MLDQLPRLNCSVYGERTLFSLCWLCVVAAQSSTEMGDYYHCAEFSYIANLIVTFHSRSDCSEDQSYQSSRQCLSFRPGILEVFPARRSQSVRIIYDNINRLGVRKVWVFEISGVRIFWVICDVVIATQPENLCMLTYSEG